jgi:hypothetical protein
VRKSMLRLTESERHMSRVNKSWDDYKLTTYMHAFSFVQ